MSRKAATPGRREPPDEVVVDLTRRGVRQYVTESDHRAEGAGSALDAEHLAAVLQRAADHDPQVAQLVARGLVGIEPTTSLGGESIDARKHLQRVGVVVRGQCALRSRASRWGVGGHLVGPVTFGRGGSGSWVDEFSEPSGVVQPWRVAVNLFGAERVTILPSTFRGRVGMLAVPMMGRDTVVTPCLQARPVTCRQGSRCDVCVSAGQRHVAAEGAMERHAGSTVEGRVSARGWRFESSRAHQRWPTVRFGSVIVGVAPAKPQDPGGDDRRGCRGSAATARGRQACTPRRGPARGADGSRCGRGARPRAPHPGGS